MSTFDTTTTLRASREFIPYAIRKLKKEFEEQGFELCKRADCPSNVIVTITKGNLFKQAIGLRQGLEISFMANENNIQVDARGIVLKNQLVASGLSLFVTWPVLIPQIIGLIRQSKLDKKAINIVQNAYTEFMDKKPVFCPYCGAEVTELIENCPVCHKQL